MDENEPQCTQADLRLQVLERMGPRPYVDYLGCELKSAIAGRVSVLLPWRPPYSRSGVAPGAEPSLHGGAAAALADIAASYALMTVLDAGESRATIDLSIHYLAPLYGNALAEAQVRRRGKRTAFIDIEIFDAERNLAAIARATFAIIPAPVNSSGTQS